MINMAREYFIGIDVGSKGYACIYDATYKSYGHYPLFEGKRLSPILIERLNDLVRLSSIAVVEQVHSMPGQGVASTFTFGTNYGKVLGMLEAIGMPYVTVTPTKWQNEMIEATDKAQTTKMTSYSAARRLLPLMDFRRSDRCKTFDDNKVDATLICLYAQRKNL